MAQVTVSDEQYQSLVALASERGMSPEQFVAALIEEFERREQLAFWGADAIENLRRQMAETEHSTRHLTEDEFFAELDKVDVPAEVADDADV